MVRGDFGRDRDAASLRPAHDLDTAGGRQVADVQACAHGFREQHVARDDRLFGDGRPAGESEFGGERPLVHLRALGESRLLGVLGDDPVERRDVLERATHEQRVVHALAVIAEHPHGGARASHRADLGEVLPRESDGDGADRPHRHVAVLVAERGDLFDDAGGVGDGLSVRHRVHRGEPAGRGSAGSGQHGLALLEARARAGGCAGRRVRAAPAVRRRRRPSASRATRARRRRRRGSRDRCGFHRGAQPP